MQTNQIASQGFISMKDLWTACLKKWKWFVFSVIVAVAIAFVYAKRTEPTYMRSISILLLNGDEVETSFSEVAIENLGLRQQNVSLRNEMELLHSPALMKQVVEKLGLEVEYRAPAVISIPFLTSNEKKLGIDLGYKAPERFYDKLLYGAEVPIHVIFSDVAASGVNFKVSLGENQNITLYDFSNAPSENYSIKAKLGQTLKNPCGQICVTALPTYDYLRKIVPIIKVSRNQSADVAKWLLYGLSVDNPGEQSSVVDISMTDNSIYRADDILNTLLNVYDENNMKNQTRMAEKTARFLEERVDQLGKELGKVDNNIASYKGSHLMPQVGAVQDIYVKNNNDIQNQIQTYNTQLAILNQVKRYLSANIGQNRMLPADIGISNQAIAQQIENYNKLQMERNEFVSYGGEGHPRVHDLNKQLEIYRKSIMESINQATSAIQKQLSSMHGAAGKTAGQIVNSTQQAKHIISTERQQKVIEELYLFLLQEKEKNDMSLNHSISNIRMLQESSGPMSPIAPNTRQIMLMGFMVGLGLPFMLIFVGQVADNKIRSRRDLKSLAVAKLGDVPMLEGINKKPFFKSLFKHKSSHKTVSIHVSDNNRDYFNESMRVVRTNLEFILHGETEKKVVMFTSLEPDCGKSFVTANLGASMSFIGKKVLMIDLDMRSCTLSTLADARRGVSNYLSYRIDDYKGLILKDQVMPGVDLLPVGSVPPNPAELLHTERLKTLIESARNDYDCVLIDCPPVDIVADVDLICGFVDVSVFVLCVGKSDKDMLGEIDHFYQENRFKGMCVLLNGASQGRGYGSHYYTSQKS